MKLPVLFSVLALTAITISAQQRNQVKRSKIAVYDLQTKSVQVIFEGNQLIEAPNWSPDGKYLLANTGGELYRLPAGRGCTAKDQSKWIDEVQQRQGRVSQR